MDICRIATAVAFFPLIYLSGTSPNMGAELHERLDAVAPCGTPGQWFAHTVVTVTIVYGLVAEHLASHGTEALAWTEWGLFAVAVAGFVVRMWCFHALGKFFTFTIGIRPDHRLVETGPYRWIVHPSYTAQLTTLSCAVLFLWPPFFWQACALVPAFVAYIVTFVNRRVALEEAAMRVKFGDEYDRYLAKRGRFLPAAFASVPALGCALLLSLAGLAIHPQLRSIG